MRVALYARVSTEDQARHGLSIETQLDNLRTWAADNNHTIVGEYVDAGISGKKPYKKRPALSQFMDDLEAGKKVDALVFTKLDRFYRSVKLYYQAVDILDRHKVSWIAIHEDYETVTASGRFKTNIMLAVAENEADRTGERIRDIMDRKIALGEYIGCPIPIGLILESKHLVPGDKADIVLGAFDTYLLSYRISAAMEYLHDHGIMYNYASVHDLLQNELYAGRFRGNPNYCTAIVPPAKFDEVQYQMQRHSVKRTPSGREYIFSGLLYCAECGRSMIGTYRARHRPENKFRYRCNVHYSSHKCSNQYLVRETEIESALLAEIGKELATISAASKSVKRRKPVDNSKKLERLTSLYVDGLISKEDYMKRRDTLTAIEQPVVSPSREKLLAISDSIKENYHALSKTEKRALWKSIVERVETDGENFHVIFRP